MSIKEVNINEEQANTLFSVCIPVSDEIGNSFTRQDGMKNNWNKVVLTCKNRKGEGILVTCLCNNPNKVLLDTFQEMLM